MAMDTRAVLEALQPVADLANNAIEACAALRLSVTPNRLFWMMMQPALATYISGTSS